MVDTTLLDLRFFLVSAEVSWAQNSCRQELRCSGLDFLVSATASVVFCHDEAVLQVLSGWNTASFSWSSHLGARTKHGLGGRWKGLEQSRVWKIAKNYKWKRNAF